MHLLHLVVRRSGEAKVGRNAAEGLSSPHRAHLFVETDSETAEDARARPFAVVPVVRLGVYLSPLLRHLGLDTRVVWARFRVAEQRLVVTG